jgi:hypothetical protein
MSSHAPKWGVVETEMMNEIFSPEVLREKVPGIGDVLDGAAHLRAMHEEIGTLGTFHKKAGFTNDRSMFRVMKIDTNIQVMLEDLHDASCQCGKGLWGIDGHRAWAYHWLNGPGKNFDVRGKIAL